MNLKIAICAVLTSLLFATPALADTVSIDRTVAAGGPTMPVIFISTPDCTAQGVTPVLYNSHPFTVTADGSYHLEVSSSGGGFASVYVFSPTFDPSAGFPTCIAADNSGNPVVLDLPLTAGTQYFAVPFDDTFQQAGGTYTLTLSGPGTINLAGAVPDVVPTLSPLGLALLAALALIAGLVAQRRRSSTT